jgi:hypothetical protein
MKDKKFSVIMVLGMLIPALLLMILSSYGLSFLEAVFEYIPLIKGGMINTNFLNESILLNSASFYMAFVSAIICSLIVVPLVKIKDKYDSQEVANLILIMIGMTFIMFLLFGMKQSDLARAVAPFGLMSRFYASTCLYYFMVTVGCFASGFMALVVLVSLPLRLLIKRLI